MCLNKARLTPQEKRINWTYQMPKAENPFWRFDLCSRNGYGITVSHHILRQIWPEKVACDLNWTLASKIVFNVNFYYFIKYLVSRNPAVKMRSNPYRTVFMAQYLWHFVFLARPSFHCNLLLLAKSWVKVIWCFEFNVNGKKMLVIMRR